MSVLLTDQVSYDYSEFCGFILSQWCQLQFDLNLTINNAANQRAQNRCNNSWNFIRLQKIESSSRVKTSLTNNPRSHKFPKCRKQISSKAGKKFSIYFLLALTRVSRLRATLRERKKRSRKRVDGDSNAVGCGEAHRRFKSRLKCLLMSFALNAINLHEH